MNTILEKLNVAIGEMRLAALRDFAVSGYDDGTTENLKQPLEQWASVADQAAAALQRLQGERDEAVAAWSASSEQWAAALQRAVSDRNTAEAQVEALRKALERADEALCQFTAFEADAREIMGNTNFAIVQQCREQVRAALASSTPERPISSEANIEPKALDCNAKGPISSAEESAVYPEWRPMSELPDPERRIILLYGDGSGSGVYFHAEGGLIYDGEDGCSYSWESRTQYSHWAYLPRGYRLWVEDSSDDPLTLPADPPLPTPAEARAVYPWRDIASDPPPVNESILVFIPNAEHYGAAIYRAMLVDMGTGRRWMTSALHMGRDTSPDSYPTHWSPLPTPPKAEADHGE